jgi:hypothetical protein
MNNPLVTVNSYSYSQIILRFFHFLAILTIFFSSLVTVIYLLWHLKSHLYNLISTCKIQKCTLLCIIIWISNIMCTRGGKWWRMLANLLLSVIESKFWHELFDSSKIYFCWINKNDCSRLRDLLCIWASEVSCKRFEKRLRIAKSELGEEIGVLKFPDCF